MITHAQLYKSEVEKKLAEFETSLAALYFAPRQFFDPITVSESSWSKIQLVSVHNGKVMGYFSATIDRFTQSIDQIAMVKFCEGHELEMAADIAEIFGWLKRHFRHIRWTTSKGSTTEAFYHRVVKDQGGYVIGVIPEANLLRDGRIVDSVYFTVPGTRTPDGISVWGY